MKPHHHEYNHMSPKCVYCGLYDEKSTISGSEANRLLETIEELREMVSQQGKLIKTMNKDKNF